MSPKSFLLATTKPSIMVLLACSLSLMTSCSNQDGDSGDACNKLLECCKSLSPAFQSSCQAIYDEWHQASEAEAQCQRGLDAMGAQCSSQTGGDVGVTLPTPQEGGSSNGGNENTNALCSDGWDNDHNGYTDCDDFGCSKNSSVTVCGGSVGAEENTNALCSDGWDNDHNGYTDCDDFGCSKNSSVTVCGGSVGAEENTNALCSDGWDNDHNGYTDCDDFGCSKNSSVTVCAGGPPLKTLMCGDRVCDPSLEDCCYAQESGSCVPRGTCTSDKINCLAAAHCPTHQSCCFFVRSFPIDIACVNFCPSLTLCETSADCAFGQACIEMSGSLKVCEY
ncbi:MAG: hypothetical protein JRH20_31705 [Deltaproteobacteria bacterium]|nr:hypothetical protein [Deltaproteobacteria bacterium]